MTKDIIDKIAMGLSAALILLGVVVLGIVEIIAGKPYGASVVEKKNEAGEVIKTLEPAVDPVIRTGLVIAAIVVLLVWSIYKVAASPDTKRSETTQKTEMTAN